MGVVDNGRSGTRASGMMVVVGAAVGRFNDGAWSDYLILPDYTS